MTDKKHTMNRREFIGWSARFLLLGGLAALVFRRRESGSGETTQDTCTDPKGYCRTCSALKYCGHPTARSFKAAISQSQEKQRS